MTPVVRRWPWLVVALLSAGCESYPDQPVFVYGRALREDGSPLSNSTFTIERRANTAGPDGAEDSSAFTLYKSVMTTPQGAFTLELPARDAEEELPWGSRAYRFRACIPSADGAMAFASFTFNAEDIELPALAPWNAALSVKAGPKGPTVMFGPPPPAPEKPASAKLPAFFDRQGVLQPTPPTSPEPIVQLSSDGDLFWQETREPGAWTLPAWLLEDFSAPQAQLRALSLGEWKFEPLWGGTSEVTFRLEWRTPREPLPKGALRPLSRGAPCMSWKQQGPCPWTDGRLDPVRLDDGQTPATEVGLTLPDPAHPSRAVIRGLQAGEAFFPEQTIIIEGSANGSNWRRLASLPIPRTGAVDPLAPFASIGRLWAVDSPLDGPLLMNNSPLFLDVPLAAGVPVRQVRLHVEGPDGRSAELSSLAEFSLFE
jgi:hypothetical protein